MNDPQVPPPETGESSDACGCESYANGQFCGIDGQCHPYSCSSWYEFGTTDFTGGYDVDSPLACRDLGSFTQPVGVSTTASVSFRCRDVTPKPIQMGFNRECTVSGTNSEFTCYELAQDTDFQPFLDEASVSQLDCMDDQYDEMGYPKFTYGVTLRNRVPGKDHTIFTPGYNGTREFNETLALTGTMYANYELWTDQPTLGPTPGPTMRPTQANQASSCSCSLLEGLWLGFLFVGFMF